MTTFSKYDFFVRNCENVLEKKNFYVILINVKRRVPKNMQNEPPTVAAVWCFM